MTVHNNYPENLIDGKKYFSQYNIWILSGHGGKTIQPTTTQFFTIQLERGKKSHVFTNIKMFTYIIPVKRNLQILNDSKALAKGFGLVTIKIPKKHYYTTLAIILYVTKPIKHNKSNCTQKIHSIHKCNHWGSQMVKNHHRYRKETQIWNNNQINISTIIGLHYHFYN